MEGSRQAQFRPGAKPAGSQRALKATTMCLRHPAWNEAEETNQERNWNSPPTSTGSRDKRLPATNLIRACVTLQYTGDERPPWLTVRRPLLQEQWWG